MGILITLLLILCALTWYYRLPFIKKIGDVGFVMVYHVKHLPELEAEFVIITKMRGRLIVEIKGVGEEAVIKLENDEAKDYLDKAGLEY
jgi:hypothetical protein